MTVGVAVIGAGTVGGGVVQLLTESSNVITDNTGLEVKLTHVCELNAEHLAAFDLTGVTVTERAEDLFAAPEVEVVCELIGGIEPAKTFVLNALKAGKNVVTANKMLIAYHGPELAETAVKHGVELRYEAAVAGGIPIIKALREGLSANRIEVVYGILNGTCNYILTRMEHEGLEFGTVLADAQAQGFAETPPDLDVEGHDTAHKCQIIASLSYGTRVPIEEIPVEGITALTADDVAYADELGYTIKLLAVVQQVDGELDARVHPTLVPKDHLLAAVRHEFNAVYVLGSAADATLYYGRGAGRMPTASAVVADILDIAGRNGAPAPPPFRYIRQLPLRGLGQVEGQSYLRVTTKDRPGVFGRIGGILGDHGVSIASCIQKDPHGKDHVHMVMMTHRTKESDLRAALRQVDALEFVIEPTHVVRVL